MSVGRWSQPEPSGRSAASGYAGNTSYFQMRSFCGVPPSAATRTHTPRTLDFLAMSMATRSQGRVHGATALGLR